LVELKCWKVLDGKEDTMATTVNRGRVVPQTESFDDESVIDPITNTTDKAPVAKTANKVKKYSFIWMVLG